MSNASALGTGFGQLDATPAGEMSAFDRLPPELREPLNYSTLDYSAVQIAGAKAGGMIQRGSVFIQTPDERGQIVAKIEAVNRAHGGPLSAKVARATLRRDGPVARSRPVLIR